MSVNQEIKFLTAHSEVPGSVFQRLVFDDCSELTQEDIYAFSERQFFKLRCNNGEPKRLLRYNRLTSPILRESRYEAYDLDGESAQSAARYIFANIDIAGRVRKRRRQYRTNDLILNFDTVFEDDWLTELYRAVEVEYFGNPSEAKNAAKIYDELLDAFSVQPFELVPYSNIHMVNMFNNSKKLRARLGAKGVGRLVLIDGGSGTGKSTIKDLLVRDFEMGYAQRDTTRSPRPDDAYTNDYRFVSRVDFDRNALSGEYIEFRDFLFGMSYGLRWGAFVDDLAGGRNMMALINLGNGHFTKMLFPEAKLILLYADPETIRARLTARGGLAEEQIAERLENNARASTYAGAYDLAINTSECPAELVAQKIMGREIWLK